MTSHRIAPAAPHAPRRPFAGVGRTALLLTALAGLAAGLTACERESESQRTVRESAAQLEAISIAGRAPAAPDQARQALNQVNQQATSATSAENKGTKAAAHVLVSQSQHQLAEGPAAEALSADFAARNLITELGGHFSRWASRIGAAQAASAFDPADQIAQIAQSKTRHQQELQPLQSELQQVRSQVNDLRAQAQAKFDQADAAQARYSQMMQRAMQMSAREAAPIVAEANESRRQSDQLRLEGGKLEARAETQAPRLTEIELLIAQKQSQISDLESIETSLASRQAAARAEAAAARAAADDAANQIDAIVVKLGEAYGEGGSGGAVMSAYDSAISAFEKSARAGREAGTAGGRYTSAKLAEGTAMQAVGDLRWQAAQSLINYAVALEMLTGAQPQIANASDYAKRAEDARARAQQMLTAAGEAYQSAVSAFSGAGGGADAERIQRLTDALGAVAAQLKGEEPPAPTMDDGGSADAGATGGDADSAAAEAAIRDVIGQYLQAMRAGDTDAMAATIDFGDVPTEELRPLFELMFASLRLDQAMQNKFNQGLMEMSQAMGGAGAGLGQIGAGAGGLSEILARTPQDYAISVSGDTATATTPNDPEPMRFKMVDGRWMIELPPEFAAARQQAQAMGPQMRAIAGAFSKVAADIESGQIATMEAAMQAMMQQMMNAVQNSPGGG